MSLNDSTKGNIYLAIACIVVLLISYFIYKSYTDNKNNHVSESSQEDVIMTDVDDTTDLLDTSSLLVNEEGINYSTTTSSTLPFLSDQETSNNTEDSIINDQDKIIVDNNDDIQQDNDKKDQLKEESIIIKDHNVEEIKVGDEYYLVMKDVGESYLDRFGLSPNDYKTMKAAGVDIIEGNFDICATPSDVLIFLENASSAGLKVILPAGAGEAEWGYPCDEDFSDTLKPIWQKDAVQAWVKKWSYHPAIFAWDISNEDGQNFPNAQRLDDAWADNGYAVSLSQLQQAYKDVKAADPGRPIMIRMNGWYFYDYDSNFFRTGNAFGPGVADIVMINAYSNVEEYFHDLVATVSNRAFNSIKAINPNAKIIIALGAWGESPMWFKPTVQEFAADINQIKNIDDIYGIGIFKYGAEEGEWLMTKDASDLWSYMSENL